MSKFRFALLFAALTILVILTGALGYLLGDLIHALSPGRYGSQ